MGLSIYPATLFYQTIYETIKRDISVLLQNTFLYVISPPTPTLLWPIFLSRSDLFLDTPTGVLGPVVPCWFTELCKK